MTEIAIAATIFNEARGESSAGRQAVKPSFRIVRLILALRKDVAEITI
jgi:hypothetical protein